MSNLIEAPRARFGLPALIMYYLSFNFVDTFYVEFPPLWFFLLYCGFNYIAFAWISFFVGISIDKDRKYAPLFVFIFSFVLLYIIPLLP